MTIRDVLVAIEEIFGNHTFFARKLEFFELKKFTI